MKKPNLPKEKWDILQSKIQGSLSHSDSLRKLYATDASAYRELPLGVVFPKNSRDLKVLIDFARKEGLSLIPRAAGTSLAGQVVGNGIVVDISRHMTEILEVNQEESWVWVEPGVIRDELNHHLNEYGLFFGPETSTSNRCMIGGMIGNNSCGSRSLVYGSTREHLLELKGFLADGSFIHTKPLSLDEFHAKCKLENLEGEIYRWFSNTLGKEDFRQEIERVFPHPDIPRRNTGYALDILANTQPFGGKEVFNLSSLLAGSEGTLVFTTEAKLNLVSTPPEFKALVCLHFNSLNASLKGNVEALKVKPQACELIDHYILDCTLNHSVYADYAKFVEGKPKALLVVELAENSEEELAQKLEELKEVCLKPELAYAAPVLKGESMTEVWNLRKAGLGLLSNIPGDEKPVAVIEDTAVLPIDLPEYIEEFNQRISAQGLYCVHYAHAATGELHLRPILNLKSKEGRAQFRQVAEDIAALVKKYKGSLSGEHGDGRLRAEFIPYMLSEKVHKTFVELKNVFDPKRILNPGKIVEAPAMDESLRYEEGQETPEISTVLNFDKWDGFIRSAEMCNGSGDCRKTEISGGTMCPSYMVTKEEKHTTRARANMIREVFSEPKVNPAKAFQDPGLEEVMDLCLSCKGCKSECPSNVDVAKLKAEILHQKIQEKGGSFRQYQFGHFADNFRKGKLAPSIFNALSGMGLTKRILGVHPNRSMPKLAKKDFFQGHEAKANSSGKEVVVFMDEFTRYLEPEIGWAAVKVLESLGYSVLVPKAPESGRSQISKGYLTEARDLAKAQVELFAPFAEKGIPILGLEPSAALSFRDEYPDLLRDELAQKAKELSKQIFLFEEFLAQELDAGKLKPSQINNTGWKLKIHGHCHQKALTRIGTAKKIYQLIGAKEARLIPSGCCGMAGSFGFEKEHFETSMKVGELVLFPSVRNLKEDEIMVAAGTSCRHQILDGVSKKALHPAEVLAKALD